MRSEKFQIALLVVLFTTIVALASIAVSQSFPQEPLFSNAVSQIEDGKKDDYKITIEKKEGFLGALASDPTAFFTAALAIVTTLLAGFTYNLLVVTRNGIAEDQRPWLSLKVRIEGPLDGDRVLRTTIAADVTNVGKTTARTIYLHAEIFGGKSFCEAESWFFELIRERTALENGRSDVGSLLAPTESETLRLGVALEMEKIFVIEGVRGQKYLAPYIGVLLTYRGMDSRKECKYTARNFAVVEVRPGCKLPFIIDIERLPIQNAYLSSYPKHARAT